MERNLEKYYIKFQRPPFAPTYYPSEDDFADPIAYVAKIKAEAEQYGVVKIVPPESFRPPFVIDSSQFEFTPRVQKLNEIDALFRVRIIFINKLVNFWHLQGQQFRLPYIENKYIDVYQLRKYVSEYGGLDQVNSERKWTVIAKRLGFKSASGSSLKQSYTRWLYPYVKSIETLEDNNNNSEDEPSGSGEAKEESETTEEQFTDAADSASARNLRRSSRMMAGVKPKPAAPAPKKRRKMSVELVYCAKCKGGDDEDRLLLCETCDCSLHTYCLDPPLSSVPKGDWRCPKCVVNAVKTFSFEFGFLDSQMKFNLDTFGEWANNFKEEYFSRAPCDVPADEVENEFWRNVVNMDKDVSVKYGADLITSKMGSGFPRKSDSFKGVDAKERILYANHPWNLNNLPVLRESVLSHINTDISGMMVPWVYVGMCFSTFCWHVEDHWTYSINYNHWGERKIWYGLSGDNAEKFDDYFRKHVPELFNGQVDLLHHMTTALNPGILIDSGIPIYTVHQNPGEFVITFPRAYHSGYNEGLNFAEAVNFAPPDWLRMGRLCLNNYASVKRTCVFSHEELVMQMVKITDRMSIQMCLSTLEELRYIVDREKRFRRRLMEGGLRESEFRKFENIPDDERSCSICCTTLYVSALVCRHRNMPAPNGRGASANATILRIVCMDHIDELCSECKLSDCCLIYRYSMEDFVPLAEKLSQRTIAFEEWRDKIEELKKDNNRIDVRVLRSLVETWKLKHYPHCKEIVEIMDVLARFDKIANAVNRILNRKIRLRDNTRCQKADTRYEFSELQRLQKELCEFEACDPELAKSLDDFCDRVTKWKARVQKSIEMDLHDSEEALASIVELIHEGEEFNIKLSEIEVLNEVSARNQWILNASQMLDWQNQRLVYKNKDKRRRSRSKSTKARSCTTKSVMKVEVKDDSFDEKNVKSIKSEVSVHDEDMDDEDDEEIGDIVRFSLAILTKTINEGKKFCILPKVSFYLEQLKEMRDVAVGNIEKATAFLDVGKGIGFAQAEKLWLEELQKTNWLDAEPMNTFRDELDKALSLNRQFSEIIEGADERHNFDMKATSALEFLCERSLFESDGKIHEQMRDINKRLTKFVERITGMLLKSVGYYNVFEIISGRDDLTALVEGDPMPRTLFKSTKYNDNWNQLKQFHSSDLLSSHLTAIYEQQLNLLMALRLINEQRPLNETCLCGGNPATTSRKTTMSSRRSFNNFSNSDNSSTSSLQANPNLVISCFVCNATFHEMCAQWEPFMGRLPEGVFLCPRCLRGRRPCLEDVEAACNSAPPNSLEKLLVANLVKRATHTFYELQNAMHRIAPLQDLSTLTTLEQEKIKQSLIMALSLEVMDVEAYEMVFSSTHFSFFFPLSDLQKDAWRRIQSRMVESSSRRLIFPPTSISPSSSRRLNNKRNSSGVLLNVSSSSKGDADLSNLSVVVPNAAKCEVNVVGDTDSIYMDKSSTSSLAFNKEVSLLADDNNHMNISDNELSATSGKRKCHEIAPNKHSDYDNCAADRCLRPYSDQVRWIQCESGCMRWYHYVCVGQTVKAAEQLSSYTCYRCASDLAKLSLSQ